MKTLCLPLKRKWFEQIRDGVKPHEFRLRNDYWKKRLEGIHYDRVVFMLGYPAREDSSRRIEGPYLGYEIWHVASEEWDNDLREVFAILTPCHGDIVPPQMGRV